MIEQEGIDFYNYFSEGSPDEVVPVKIENVLHPIYMRRHTSDIKNFQQVFHAEEYAPVFNKIGKPQVIVDLGAYIGLSAVYFKRISPQAKIICVEPSKENFEILKLNTQHYDDIHIINAAAWSENIRLKLDFNLDGEWGNRYCAYQRGDVQGISINSTIKTFGIKRIDLLKMDVEGSERFIFSEHTSWVNKVDCVAVELHERFFKGCVDTFNKLFTEDKFDIFSERETTVAVRR